MGLDIRPPQKRTLSSSAPAQPQPRPVQPPAQPPRPVSSAPHRPPKKEARFIWWLLFLLLLFILLGTLYMIWRDNQGSEVTAPTGRSQEPGIVSTFVREGEGVEPANTDQVGAKTTSTIDIDESLIQYEDQFESWSARLGEVASGTTGTAISLDSELRQSLVEEGQELLVLVRDVLDYFSLQYEFYGDASAGSSTAAVALAVGDTLDQGINEANIAEIALLTAQQSSSTLSSLIEAQTSFDNLVAIGNQLRVAFAGVGETDVMTDSEAAADQSATSSAFETE